MASARDETGTWRDFVAHLPCLSVAAQAALQVENPRPRRERRGDPPPSPCVSVGMPPMARTRT